MDTPEVAVAPPPLGGPFRLHPFRPRGRLDAGTPTLFVHEWTAEGFTVRALVGLLDLTAGPSRSREAAVWPHERVHPEQVDQLAQRMARGRVDPAPILLAHRGPQRLRELLGEVCSEPPRVVRTVRDQRQRAWAVARPSELAQVRTELAAASALLADGHHRYAAHHQLRSAGHPGGRRALAALVDQEDTPLHIGAIHRVLHLDEDPRRAAALLLTRAREAGWAVSPRTPTNPLLCVAPGRVVVSDGTGAFTLTLPPVPGPPGGRAVATTTSMPLLGLTRLLEADRRTTVSTSYHHEADLAVEDARRHGGVALLLPAPSLDEVLTVVRQNRLLPEKATSFQPKPRPGMITRRLRDA